MKRTYIITFLFLILLITRCFFIDKSENIILYITLINSISFIIVVISIIEEMTRSIKVEVNNRSIPSQLKGNQIKEVKKKTFILSLCSLAVFFGTIISSEIYNDILSIVTVGISLLDNEISTLLKKIVKRWCKI